MARPAPGQRADYAHFATLPTRWADNDQYGHMNNVIHYALFDTAISDWQLAQGFFDAKGVETRMVVVESGCRYHAEAGWPDTIHVGLRLAHLGTSSWRYDLGLFRNDEAQAFAEGFFAQVLVDAGTGRPTPLSDATRQRLETLRR
jgi:acyl-CoA thioester hydrolase